jgi:glucose/arabinose dehydrogenase
MPGSHLLTGESHMHHAGAARGLRTLPFAAALLATPAFAVAAYRIERIASGLNQPTYITQAPGDPANIVYITERTSNTIAGFGAINEMGRVLRYNTTTRTSTVVLDLSSRDVINDDGLQTIAFHPNFGNVGSVGYQKMYVSSAAYPNPGNALNRVEEYTIGVGMTATFNRTILQYANNTQNNHTVNWIGFDPTATGAARSYLYISTGDGAFGNNYNNGAINGRPSQNPSSARGKMLRVDVSGGDDYDGNHSINGVQLANDGSRSFVVPLSNPLPTFNAANPGSFISGFNETYITGLRNVSRASIDRLTGDLWMGDVGETMVEELSFLKAGTNVNGPPVDYGWPLKEGTQDSTIAGIPAEQNRNVNPFTGVTSLRPIQQFAHTAGGNAIIGGYVYRGPVSELEGKYFYADYVPGKILQLEFDRDTPVAGYNGNNGTLTEMTLRFNSRVFDPTDPAYVGSTNIADLPGIDHLVSFGEDNAGNLYIVDFGPGTGFPGQYPGAGMGEIFRVIAGTVDASWKSDLSGSWFTSANWTGGGVPGLRGDQANFGPVLTAPRSVALDGAQSVSTLTIDSVHSYTLSGAGTLTLQGLSPAVLSVASGTHTISAPVTLPGDLQITTAPSAGIIFTWSITDASGSMVTKLGAGSAQFVSLRAATLAATEGTVKISAKAAPNFLGAVVQNVTFGSGLLDITNNSMVLDYSGPVGSLVDDTRANLLTGRLFSSVADDSRVLGYGDNDLLGFGTFAGHAVDSSSVLIKYTYAGDTDLDGDVDVADLGALASSWQGSAAWTGGDFDYNGFVNVNDLGMLASNWQAGVGEPLGPGSLAEALASLGLPAASVPEPYACSVMLAAAWLLRRRPGVVGRFFVDPCHRGN